MYALFIPAPVVGIFVVIWRIVLYYFNIALGILSSIIIVRREAKNAKSCRIDCPGYIPQPLYQMGAMTVHRHDTDPL